MPWDSSPQKNAAIVIAKTMLHGIARMDFSPVSANTVTARNTPRMIVHMAFFPVSAIIVAVLIIALQIALKVCSQPNAATAEVKNTVQEIALTASFRVTSADIAVASITHQRTAHTKRMENKTLVATGDNVFL
jgi:hypothetical protein